MNDTPTSAGADAGRVRGVVFALLTLGAVTAAALLAAFPRGLPRPAPPEAPPDTFSAARAAGHVAAIAGQPHPNGSPANRAVRDYLLNHLRSLGLEAEVQPGIAHFADENQFGVALLENVVARVRGTAPGAATAFMLVAHYDSVATGPGASDDGAGVATLLETARAIRAGPAPRNDVVFLFTDAEEACRCGARVFGSHPWAKDVGLVLNLEARGNRGPLVLFETSTPNSSFIPEVARGAPLPVASSLAPLLYDRSGSTTDLWFLRTAGLAGMSVAPIQGITHYHSRLDTPQALDPGSLQHMGSYALGLARHFGNQAPARMGPGNRVYFSLFGRLIHYPESWAAPLVAVIALAFAVVAAYGARRRRLSLRGTLWGFLAVPASTMAALAAALAAWRLVLLVDRDGHPLAFEYRAGFFWCALVALTVAVAALLHAAFRRRATGPELTVGALVWWLLLAAATAWFFRPASYLFVWPLLFGLVALAFVWRDTTQPVSWLGFAGVVLAAVAAVLVFAPVLYGVSATLGLFMYFALPATLALMLTGLTAQLTLAGPRMWTALSVAAVAVAVGFFAVGTAVAGFDAAHPRWNSLFYLVNLERNRAAWASEDDAPDRWTAQFLGENARKEPVDDLLAEGGAGPLLRRDATVVSFQPAAITVLEDSAPPGSRRLRLAVGAPVGALRLRVSVAGAARIAAVSFQGTPLTLAPGQAGSGPKAAVQVWTAPPAGLELLVEAPAGQPVQVTTRASLPGLPDLPPTPNPPRPPDTMARPFGQFEDGWSHVVHSTTVPARQ